MQRSPTYYSSVSLKELILAKNLSGHHPRSINHKRLSIQRRMGCERRKNESLDNDSKVSNSSSSEEPLEGYRSFKLQRLMSMENNQNKYKNHQISLNRSEARLCQLLDQFTLHVKNSALQNTTTNLDSLELRIAGGWVRDKLLGVESNDLDIAISSLTGQEFAKLFSEFVNNRHYRIEQKGNQEDDNHHSPTRTKQEPIERIGKISTIEARPDQSKHLETATTTFLGLDLDFVQLRTEEYGAQESRIPSAVRFGTPLEDALRRDITINSLFYHVHNREIEDHTGKGLTDLETGLIRTPLPAEQTFKDDPLRLLRCIRFSTRFGFKLDSEIILAAKSEPIRIALKEKISRERVGTEVDKMLKGRDPLSSLRLINDLGLYQLVFSLPLNMVDSPIEPSLAVEAAAWLDRITDSINQQELPSLHSYLLDFLSRFPVLRRRLFLACALLPYRFSKVKSGKKQVCAAEVVLMESLKLGNHDKNFLVHLLQGLELLNTTTLKSILSSPSIRLELGRLIRNPHVHDIKQLEADASLTWQASFLFSLVVELNDLKFNSHIKNDAPTVIETFNQAINKILELDLGFVVTSEFEKSRLDGKEICQILNIKPGRQVAQIIEKLIDRQIDFPNQSKEDGSKWLEDQVKSGQIEILDK